MEPYYEYMKQARGFKSKIKFETPFDSSRLWGIGPLSMIRFPHQTYPQTRELGVAVELGSVGSHICLYFILIPSLNVTACSVL